MNVSMFNSTNLLEPEVDKCMNSFGQYKTECLYNTLCPQMHDYFVHTGVILILLYFVVTWFLHWFINGGYKKIMKNSQTKLFGNLDMVENRLKFDLWVRHRLMVLFVGFVVVVVYFKVVS